MTLRVIRTPMSSSDEAGILPASQKRIEERRVPCVAGGDGPELLELGEGVLDEVARLVEIFVKGARHLAGFPRRDDGRLAGLGQRLEHPLIRLEPLVGNERLGLKLREQGIRSSQVMLLTAGQMKADRIAERIHRTKLPRASTRATILVVRPPRGRPIVWFRVPPLRRSPFGGR